jgi:hypothetical protein
MGFIYLLQEREHIRFNESIYKLGSTKNPIKIRVDKYPINSDLLYLRLVDNHVEVERNLRNIFKSNFKQRTDVGREYFEGYLKNMINVLNDYIINPINKQLEKKVIEKPDISKMDDQTLGKYAKFLLCEFKLNPKDTIVVSFILNGLFHVLSSYIDYYDDFNILYTSSMLKDFLKYYNNKRIIEIFLNNTILTDLPQKSVNDVLLNDIKLVDYYIKLLRCEMSELNFSKLLYPPEAKNPNITTVLTLLIKKSKSLSDFKCQYILLRDKWVDLDSIRIVNKLNDFLITTDALDEVLNFIVKI